MYRTEPSGCVIIYSPQPLGPQSWVPERSHIFTSIVYLTEQKYALSSGTIEINLFPQMLPIKIDFSKNTRHLLLFNLQHSIIKKLYLHYEVNKFLYKPVYTRLQDFAVINTASMNGKVIFHFTTKWQIYTPISVSIQPIMTVGGTVNWSSDTNKHEQSIYKFS